MNLGFPLFPEQASTMASRVDALYFVLIGVTVACTCIRANDSWQLDVRASFIPRLVMPRLTGHLLQHEMRHVSDIHDAITRYVASIASQEFASEGECERSRVAIEHSFESTVSTFAKESQKARR